MKKLLLTLIAFFGVCSLPFTVSAQTWRPMLNPYSCAPDCQLIDSTTGDMYIGGGCYNGGTMSPTAVLKLNTDGSFTNMDPHQRFIYVSSLAFYNGALYASGGVSGGFRKVKKYNVQDNDWEDFGAPNDFNNAIHKMLVYQNELYVGGLFTSVSGMSVNGLVKLASSGTAWDTIPGSPKFTTSNDQIADMCIMNGILYVAGAFEKLPDGTIVNNIVSYNGTTWAPLIGSSGNGLQTTAIDELYRLTVYDNALIVAGHFTNAGGVQTNNVAKWDGDWHAMPGIDFFTQYSSVFSVAVDKGTLYACGRLSFFLNGDSAKNIVMWNDTLNTWQTVAGGIGYPNYYNNVPAFLCSWQGQLLCGGGFLVSLPYDGDTARVLARLSPRPTIVTLPATDITQTTATLNGMVVDSSGDPINAGYEYSLDQLGWISSQFNFDGVDTQILPAPIDSLLPDTLYTFAIRVTKFGQTAYGEWLPFVTLAVDESTVGHIVGNEQFSVTHLGANLFRIKSEQSGTLNVYALNGQFVESQKFSTGETIISLTKDECGMNLFSFVFQNGAQQGEKFVLTK